QQKGMISLSPPTICNSAPFTLGAVLEQQEHTAALTDRPAAPDENLPPLLREALQIMDSDDGEQAFLHGLESLIRGFEVQLTALLQGSAWERENILR
ncbi:TetR/AcrR family transcriptional regulator C-terminal domain-containing protein, partial [Klebsiella pneumoniae]